MVNPVDNDAPAGGLVTSQDPEESLLRDYREHGPLCK